MTPANHLSLRKRERLHSTVAIPEPMCLLVRRYVSVDSCFLWCGTNRFEYFPKFLFPSRTLAIQGAPNHAVRSIPLPRSGSNGFAA